MRVLVTGGAGFVGAHLARAFARDGDDVVAFDNLRRRGAELNLPLLRDAGVAFAHGDVRVAADLQALDGDWDVVLDGSAEPSVHAGSSGSPRYVIDTNLGGTINALELARERRAAFVFLSTSRVYSIGPLRGLELRAAEERFVLDVDEVETAGLSEQGVTEDFPTHKARSLYGATKLASELLVQEYAATYALPAVIDRCGVIAGPGQFGRVDQGVFTLWVAHHLFGRPLRYTGFGGRGLQVRDLLHPDDLYRLLRMQLEALPGHSGEVFNVGGGMAGSVSLREWTRLSCEAAGRELDIAGVEETAAVDIPWFVADSHRASAAFEWTPAIRPSEIAQQIAAWLQEHRELLAPLFGAQ